MFTLSFLGKLSYLLRCIYINDEKKKQNSYIKEHWTKSTNHCTSGGNHPQTPTTRGCFIFWRHPLKIPFLCKHSLFFEEWSIFWTEKPKIHSSPKPVHDERNIELEDRQKVRWELTNKHTPRWTQMSLLENTVECWKCCWCIFFIIEIIASKR